MKPVSAVLSVFCASVTSCALNARSARGAVASPRIRAFEKEMSWSFQCIGEPFYIFCFEQTRTQNYDMVPFAIANSADAFDIVQGSLAEHIVQFAVNPSG